MRVPNAIQGTGLLQELNRIRAEINRSNRELVTGKRVIRPSDDPAAAARAVARRDEISTLQTYRESTEDASSRLTAIDNILDALERLNDAAAVAAAAGRSGTTDASAFSALSDQVEGIRAETLRIANGEHNGRHLFGGQQTLASPFVETGGVVNYVGDATPTHVRVDNGTVVETSIPGSDLFVSGLSTFQVLTDLRDALSASDVAGVEAQAQNLEQLATRYSQYRSRVGASLNQLDRHRLYLQSVENEERFDLSRDVDADLASSISDLSSASTALEAALGAGGRLVSASLLDVLG